MLTKSFTTKTTSTRLCSKSAKTKLAVLEMKRKANAEISQLEMQQAELWWRDEEKQLKRRFLREAEERDLKRKQEAEKERKRQLGEEKKRKCQLEEAEKERKHQREEEGKKLVSTRRRRSKYSAYLRRAQKRLSTRA